MDNRSVISSSADSPQRRATSALRTSAAEQPSNGGSAQHAYETSEGFPFSDHRLDICGGANGSEADVGVDDGLECLLESFAATC